MTSAYAGYRLTNSTGSALHDTWVQLSNFTGGSVALGSGQPAAEQLASLDAGTSKSLFWYLSASGTNSSAQGHAVTVYSHQPGLADSSVLCATTGGFSAVSPTIGANANKITSVALSSATPTLGATFTVTVQGTTGTIGSGPASPLTDPQSLWTSPSSISGWPAGAYRLVGTQVTVSPDGSSADQTYNDTLHLTNLGSSSRSYTAVYTFQATGFTATPSTLLPVEQIASGTQIKHTGSYPSTISPVRPATNDLALAVTASPARLPRTGGTSTYTATISGTTGASLDALVLTLPSGAAIIAGSGRFDGASLADPVSDGNGHVVFQGPFTLTPGQDTLTFQLSHSPGTGPRQTTVVGNVGTTVIDTTPDDLTDDSPATATVVLNTSPSGNDDTATVAANSAADTIAVLANDSDADGDALSVDAVDQPAHGSASYSANAVSYTPVPGYTGPDSFTYSISDGNGGTATATVRVTVDASAMAQVLTFAPLSDAVLGSSPVARATSDAGLDVTYTSLTPSTCSVAPSSGVMSLVSAGTCTIQADQGGDETYVAAAPVQRTFTIAKADQTITFTQPADVALAARTTTVAASADSGLPISYSSATQAVCTVDPSTALVRLIGTGECTLVAAAPGNATYAAAADVTRSFAVTTAPQAIAFAQPGDVNLSSGTVALDASSDSGMPVSFSTATPSVCTVSPGGTVTLLTGGTCTISADQSGNYAYEPAAQVRRSFAVIEATPAAQDITFDPIADTPLLNGSINAHAVSDSGLTVAYRSTTPSKCDVDAISGVVDLLAAGTCTIDATAAGDATHAAAVPTSRSFEITRTSQQIDFSALADVLLLHGPMTATATASSGLPVSFDSSTDTVCTVDSNGIVALIASGTCSLTATQPGSAAYSAADPVTRSFEVLRSPQTITFPQPSGGRVGDTIDLTAVSDSALDVTYKAGPSTVCELDEAGTSVHLIGTGTCDVTARQAGNDFYLPQTTMSSFGVSDALQTQTISFPAIARAHITDTGVAAHADADSGLAVSYSSLTPTMCSVTQGGAVTLLSTGVCALEADQPGDAAYAPAAPATSSFSIVRAPQTITLVTPTDTRIDTVASAVRASASSGLPISYLTRTPDACTVAPDGSLTLLAVGPCTVAAGQPGSDVYEPAPTVTHTFAVTAIPQTLTLTAPAQEDVSIHMAQVTATSDAGLPVHVTAGPARICSIRGTTLTLMHAGLCTVAANAAGDMTHTPAATVHTVVEVTAQIADKSYTLPPSSPAAGAPSAGLDVLQDQPGQALLSVTQPRYGRVVIEGRRLRITLPKAYKGTETFTYTTRDAVGAMHTATVAITVPDSPPRIEPVTTAMIAGTHRSVLVPVTDANRDRLTITVGAHPDLRVTVSGHRLTITPGPRISGLVAVPVTVSDGDGGVARAVVHVLVSPRPTTSAVRQLVPLGTRVRWTAVRAAGARYAVVVDGVTACVTSTLTCVVPRFLGRRAAVKVIVFGLDGTRSTLTPAAPRAGKRHLLGTVYFATNCSTLSRPQHSIAAALGRRALSDGFTAVSIVGYTDSRGSRAYNLALSHRRSRTVAALMQRRFRLTTTQDWRGEGDPASTNATARGMSLNRRVEIWVS